MLKLINSKYQFSYYKNLYTSKNSKHVLNINEIIEIIKYGYLKKVITKLRLVQEKETYNKIKVSEIPAVTLSGVFSQRNSKGLQKHSGLIQIDIDQLDSYQEVLEKIIADSYTYVAFKSPGGRGIKVIVKINPDVSTHLEQFYALEQYYKDKFDVVIDPSCKDVARCLLLSYDPNLYCNPFSDVFEECYMPVRNEIKKEVQNYTEVNLKITNQEDVLEQLVQTIEKLSVDITDSYENWIKVGYAVSEAMGESGRISFHRISQFHPEYNQAACDKQYTSINKRNNGAIKLGSLIFLANEKGITVNSINHKTSNLKVEDPKSKYGKSLFEKLRDFRQRISKEKEMSLFYIYNNATLDELVKKRPRSIKDLEKIKGIGKKKIAWFGKELLEEINQ